MSRVALCAVAVAQSLGIWSRDCPLCSPLVLGPLCVALWAGEGAFQAP
jgi:hypothetical protein